VLAWLEGSEFSVWERSETLWGWPLSLTLHTLGTALVIGFIFIVNLRLIGLFETIPYTSLKRLFPVIWVAFAVQFVTGFALWATKPTRYVADTAFMLKFSFLVIGFILTLYLYGTMKREAASWEAAGAVSSRGFKFAAPSLLVWCVVLITARLTAHLGSLYSG
jgi:hypothetical protein